MEHTSTGQKVNNRITLHNILETAVVCVAVGDMSATDLGLLTVLCACPYGDPISVKWLASRGRVGRDRAARAMATFVRLGFVEATRHRDENGRMSGSSYRVRGSEFASHPFSTGDVVDAVFGDPIACEKLRQSGARLQ